MTETRVCAYILSMNDFSAKSIPIFAFLLSGALLCGAWFFQYVLGYPPCQMCYWQRHAHKAVLILAILALVLAATGRKYPKAFAILIGLAFIASFALAFWHVGVEYKWWEGPKTCSGAIDEIKPIDPSKIWDDIDDVKLPACSDAPWHFLGLSMAGWNAVFSSFGAMLSFASLRRDKNA